MKIGDNFDSRETKAQRLTTVFSSFQWGRKETE
jgi:hypothetical protein